MEKTPRKGIPFTKEKMREIDLQCKMDGRFRMNLEKYWFLKKLLRKYFTKEELIQITDEFWMCEQICVSIDEPPLRLNIVDVAVAAGQVAYEKYGHDPDVTYASDTCSETDSISDTQLDTNSKDGYNEPSSSGSVVTFPPSSSGRVKQAKALETQMDKKK